MDRSAIYRALSKALAHKNVGNQSMAELWAVELVRLLECENILIQEVTHVR